MDPLFAGIDVGSSSTKAVVISGEGLVLGRGIAVSAADFVAAANAAFQQSLAEAGSASAAVRTVAATGYGRNEVQFAQLRRTEIDCHARGAYHHFPVALTVVDIGGQDNKIISLDARGRRLSFKLNRKCAAGTGAFLEEMARRLNIPMEELGALAERATDKTVAIGSYCSVFAMSEVLAKIRVGVKAADLARAALQSVARRVLEMQAVLGMGVVTGGVVAHMPLLALILSENLGIEVKTPPFPQYIGALGAALYAAQHSPTEGS